MTWMPPPGTFATTGGLRRAGASEQALTAAVRNGSLRRVRRGVYTDRAASDPQSIAVAMQGRLTGISAIAARGGWCWQPSGGIHVAVAPTSSRLMPTDQVAVHWVRPSSIGSDATESVVSTADAVVRVILDEPLETAVAAADWALSTGRIDRFQWQQILLQLPRSSSSIVRWVDGTSQSVLESVARVRILRRGWTVRSQVRVGDLGGIDLVVEGLVALELDGRQFHEATFESDRRKDLQITIEGRHAIRVSASMVRDSWPHIELAIATALALARRGDAGTTGVDVPSPRGRRRSPARRWQELL